jgi:hypothetical protein
VALILAYVGVLKYMAEKPEAPLDAEGSQHATIPLPASHGAPA